MTTPLHYFTVSYIGTALWSSCDEAGNPLDNEYDESAIHADTHARMVADCKAFFGANEALILADDAPLSRDGHGLTEADSKAAMAGHDFWLTRNGHGAGFWDGDWPNEGAKLSAAARAFGNVDLNVGDDDEIHGM